jgi:hypothetical protein
MKGMRSLVLSSILAAATLGACSQSLVPNMPGTGGSPTGFGGGAGGSGGFGGTGGTNQSTGGTGGDVWSQTCTDLVNKYWEALPTAETCQVGAPFQCQQLVSGSLSGCSCPVYVTDTSQLATIATAFETAKCVTPTPACDITCPSTMVNTTCVAVDGGSFGFCSWAPSNSGTGGSDGSGGSGGGKATGGSSGFGGSSVDGGPIGPGPLVGILTPSSYTPGDYMLTLSNVPISCDNTSPASVCSPQGVTYSIGIQMLPSVISSPGSYPLASLVNPYFSDTGPNIDAPTDCWGGVGSFTDGALDVESVSSETLIVDLQGTLTIDFDANGVAIPVQRCPGTQGPPTVLF